MTVEAKSLPTNINLMQNVAMFIQFAIAAIIGCIVFAGLSPDPNPKVPLFGALICGFGGSWLLMKLYVFFRYGWAASKSMSLDP